MKSRTVALTFLLLGINTLAFAQAAPAVTATTPAYNSGVIMPAIDGNFQYALSVSELIQSGYYGSGIGTTTNFGGDLEYTSLNTKAPFSVLYAGGYLLTQNYGQNSSTYQSLTISQGLVYGRWSMGVSDSVSYLPNSPSTGLAGVPGVGDLGLPVQTGSDVPSQSILTNYVRRLSNTAAGHISYQLNGRTSISASGSDGKLYFFGEDGLNSNQVSGTVSLNRQLDHLNTVGLTANYTTFTYADGIGNFHSRGLSAYYTRIWNRRITTTVSGGPQWISAFNGLTYTTDGTGTVAVPGRVTFAGSAVLTYNRKFTTATLAYNRSANGGSGVQTGAIGDAVSAGVSRAFGRNWSTSASVTYSRTSGLTYAGTTDTVYAGVQANRRLTQHLSAFVSYTLQDQQLAGALVTTGAFSGVSHTGAIGLTYSPRAARLGQF